MSKVPSQWLIPEKGLDGDKPGKALAKWLNQPDLALAAKFVEELVLEAQFVFRWIKKYDSLRKLNLARRQNKLPPSFWKSHEKLNETLANLTYAPQVDLHEIEDGESISWNLISERLPLSLPSVECRLLVKIIEQGKILKIRRCQHCTRWFFAHFSHQLFCKTPCRLKHLTGTERFKKKRRKYMRAYNALKKSGKVK